jgi:hypothetical protein
MTQAAWHVLAPATLSMARRGQQPTSGGVFNLTSKRPLRQCGLTGALALRFVETVNDRFMCLRTSTDHSERASLGAGGLSLQQLQAANG